MAVLQSDPGLHYLDVLTVDDVHRRLKSLTEEHGLAEAFLIPGLFHFMVADYEQHAAEAEMLLDGRTQKALDVLKESRARWPVEMQAALPDELIQHMIDDADGLAVWGLEYIADNQREAAELRALWEERFPKSYWQEWRKHTPIPCD